MYIYIYVLYFRLGLELEFSRGRKKKEKKKTHPKKKIIKFYKVFIFQLYLSQPFCYHFKSFELTF